MQVADHQHNPQTDDCQTAVRIPQGQHPDAALSQLAGYARQRGCVPIPTDFFTKVLPTLSEAELRVYLYQMYRTLGFGKQSDSIAVEQFIDGITDRDGVVKDRGCGLKSAKSVRKATQRLAEKGLVTKTRRRSHIKGDKPNKYTFNLGINQTRLPEVPERKVVGEGIAVTPHNASSKRDKQRCGTTQRKTGSKRHKIRCFMDAEHVDYLIDQIEKVTDDIHSRGAFAQVAMRLDEGQIMEVLAVLKDRGNVRNKGAWFLATCHQVLKRRSSQRRPSQRRPAYEAGEQSDSGAIPPAVSLKTLLWSRKRALAQTLGLPPSVGQGAALYISEDATRHRVGRGVLAALHPT